MITINGNILSVGINVARNNPKYITDDIAGNQKSTVFSYHAEQVAIRRARGNVIGSTMYVVRVSPGGNGRMSAPCERCMPQLIRAGIRKVYFTTGEPGGLGLIKL